MIFGVATYNGTSDSKEVSNAEIRLFEEIAVVADKLGFELILFTDHYKVPWRTTNLDAWSLISYLASKTEHIRLGTCVTPLTLRPPPILAKIVTTVDVLSQGRAILGVGAGWSKEEFEGYGTWDEAGVRFEKTAEALQLLLRLWSEESVSFNGAFYRTKDTMLRPKPVQKPHPPLFFGSEKRRMLELAGKYGQGWVGLGPRWLSGRTLTVDGYRENASVVRDSYRRCERKDSFHNCCLFGPLENRSQCVSEIESFKEAGLDCYVLGFPPDEKALDSIRFFSKEVMPSFV